VTLFEPNFPVTFHGNAREALGGARLGVVSNDDPEPSYSHTGGDDREFGRLNTSTPWPRSACARLERVALHADLTMLSVG